MASDQGLPPEAYDRDYFLSECEGHEEYLRSGGRVLPRRLRTALGFAGHIAGLRVLDLGCGRGELARYCAENGARMVLGLDYSPDALALSADILDGLETGVAQANVQHLPLTDASFDLAFALDLVEHLYPQELEAMFREAHRVLAPGGRLIVHTMPNIWYYRYGYPPFRLIQHLRGIRLPRDPRDRWRRVHVNEQSIVTLAQSLKKAGFDARVRLHNTQDFSREGSPVARALYGLLATVYPFAWVFCNDLFAVATKEDG